MTTLLLGLILAQNAVAAEAADCAEAQVIVARHDIVEARQEYRSAHADFFAIDWKARMAVADDRDAVLGEREQRWEEVKALREAIGEARVAWREVKSRAAEGVLACDDAPSGGEAAQAEKPGANARTVN